MSKFIALSIVALLTTLAGCASMQTTAPNADVHSAVCVLYPTKGNDVTGVIRFTDAPGSPGTPGSVRVVADVKGLAPNSKHGFHIHEYGDTDCPDGTCTGGHYDPDHTGHHAMPGDAAPHHAGDMGNLTADANGEAHYDQIITNITVAGSLNPIIGRAVIVHTKPDDGGQPTGNAGSRMAAGVIGIAKE